MSYLLAITAFIITCWAIMALVILAVNLIGEMLGFIATVFTLIALVVVVYKFGVFLFR